MTQLSPAELAEAWQSIAATEEGRLILSDLANRYGYQHRTTFKEHEPMHHMAYREGQRAVMIHIGYMLELDPNAYRAKMQEHDLGR